MRKELEAIPVSALISLTLGSFRCADEAPEINGQKCHNPLGSLGTCQQRGFSDARNIILGVVHPRKVWFGFIICWALS